MSEAISLARRVPPYPLAWTQAQVWSGVAALLFVLSITSAAQNRFRQSSTMSNVAPEFFQGLRYRLVGPSRGGRVTTVTGVPSQPKTFYMGVASGGLFRTTDGGASWTPITDGKVPLGSTGAVAVAERAQELLQAPSTADPSQLATVEQFLEGHAGRHPNTRATVYSLYYLGSIAFSRGNYDLAISRFRAGIATGKEAGVLRYLLREGIASSLEAKGDFDAAAAAYRDAGSVAGADMKTQSRLGEARVLGLAGKKTEAAALYRLILQESPETPLRDLIEIQLAQAG